MKYSLAIIALLGLTSTVEGVKIQNLVGLNGDDAKAPAEKKDAKKAPVLDLPPENKANTTFRKESALGPDKKLDYKKEKEQKKCKKGDAIMDSFDNCPVPKEDKEAKKEEPKPLMVYEQKMTDGWVAHEKTLEDHFDTSYKGSLQTIHGQGRAEKELTSQFTKNQEKWAKQDKQNVFLGEEPESTPGPPEVVSRDTYREDAGGNNKAYANQPKVQDPLMVYKQKMTDGWVGHEKAMTGDLNGHYKGTSATIGNQGDWEKEATENWETNQQNWANEDAARAAKTASLGRNLIQLREEPEQNHTPPEVVARQHYQGNLEGNITTGGSSEVDPLFINKQKMTEGWVGHEAAMTKELNTEYKNTANAISNQKDHENWNTAQWEENQKKWAEEDSARFTKFDALRSAI